MKFNVFRIFLYLAIIISSAPEKAMAQQAVMGKLSTQLRMLVNATKQRQGAQKRGVMDFYDFVFIKNN